MILDWTERALAAVLEAYHGIATVAEALRGGGESEKKAAELAQSKAQLEREQREALAALQVEHELTLTLTLTLTLQYPYP